MTRVLCHIENMSNARKTPPAYEVEFIPIERRLVAGRKVDRESRNGNIGLAYPNERRQKRRRAVV